MLNFRHWMGLPPTKAWGVPLDHLRLDFPLRCLKSLPPQVDPRQPLTVRPLVGRQDHWRIEQVRLGDRQWLQPWEATLPPGSLDTVPTLSQFQRRLDSQVFEGSALPMLVEIGDEAIGMVSVGEVSRAALQSASVGYWICSRWAGRGVGALAVAAVIDLLLSELGLHRVEINIRPENQPSLGLVRKLNLREEGLRSRYMCIGGKWCDHLSFAIDSESLPAGGLVHNYWQACL
ncbi:MAG: GNAT family protein [Actinomycetaceae bacterium]|nr:GNAT family protein [Actinomycetaceae bacterium]